MSDPSVTFDDGGVHLDYGERSGDMPWDNLARVAIVTTDTGPIADDVFIVLLDADDEALVVPHGATGGLELLARLQQLPDFDNETFIRAMASAENARFLVWSRDGT